MNKLYEDIIKILCEDARINSASIAKMLNEKEPAIAAAIADMEKTGVIVKYCAHINNEKLGKDLVEALIEVKVSPQHNRGFDSIAEEIYQFKEVKSLFLMSGGYDLAVMVEGRTLKEVALFVSEKLAMLDKVLSTATHFILKKYKSEGVLLESDHGKRLVMHV